MQFGINTINWVSPLTMADVEKLVPHVAGMGFDWIEFGVGPHHTFDYRRAGDLARQHNLGLSAGTSMKPNQDLLHPDAEIRANGVAFLQFCIDAAHTMGAAILVGPLYSAPGRFWLTTADERARDVDRLVQQLSHLSAYASDHGITLCIEPLNRFHTSFMNLATQAIEVIDRVNHPACQILLDTVHMNIEEKSFGDAIRATGARLRHFHVCENDRGAPGSGHIPWQEVAQALHDIQYDGPVVIESFTDKVETVALAAAAWRPVAASQDALARDGLAFLQALLRR